MDTVVIMDSDSESDPEITGCFLVDSVRPSERKMTARDDVIVLSDEDEEEVYCTPLKEASETVKGDREQVNGQLARREGTSKRRLSDSAGPQVVEAPILSKRPALQGDSVTDDSEEERPAPSWKEQEEMVRRLQKIFPNLLKEELREVLLNHVWQFDTALEALPDISAEKARRKTTATPPSHPPSSVAPLFSVAPTASQPPTPQNANPTTTPSPQPNRPSNGSVRTARRTKRRRGSQHVVGPISSSDGGSTNSDFDQSDDPGELLDSSSEEEEEEVEQRRSGDRGVKGQIVCFFQEASLEELTLISGCSAKKAQKIIELRPFNDWDKLMEVFSGGSGLSEELLTGCRAVLREREVVQGLMSRCQKISEKMVKEVKQVVEKSDRHRQPQLLNNKFQLKPYQLIGLIWLRLLHQHQLSGILADEMGLGKTIQAISLLASLFEEGNSGPHLITVPASTLDNWVRELNLWCPSFKVLVYHGSIAERKLLRNDILLNRLEYNIIISTYSLTTGSEDRRLFQKLSLEYAVFDEGHMLKNMNTLRYRHLMAINARHRLLLTGTPLQNNLLELMSLLNFIMPHLLSSCSAKLHKMFSMKSSEEQNCFEMEQIAQAKLIIKPFILRRVKSEVLNELPAKELTVEFCPMSQRQKQLYDALLQRLKGTNNGEKRELTNVMMQLRKMANHPLLHRQHYTSFRLAAMSQLLLQEPSHHDADPELIQEDMEVMSDFQLHQLCLQHPVLQHYSLNKQLLLDSGKFSLLTQLLATIKHRGERAVLFSQFTMMLDILEVFLNLNQHRYVRLDGSTPVAARMGLIDEFNSQPELLVFLLSTKAGGLGINLTSANVVIIHDIDCNPYNDKQAEDRCHRLGQTRTVRVIKLVTQDSIEDSILNIGKKKLKLEQEMTATQDGNEGSIPDDIAALLKVSMGL